MLDKEDIGPAVMVGPPAPSPTAATLAQNAAQTHADPLVKGTERGPVAVLEVCKPAHQTPIDIRDDHGKTVPICTLRLGTEGCLELLETLRPRPAHPPLKMIPEEVESPAGGGIDDTGFCGVKRKPGLGCPALSQSRRPMRLSLRATRNDEVIGNLTMAIPDRAIR